MYAMMLLVIVIHILFVIQTTMPSSNGLTDTKYYDNISDAINIWKCILSKNQTINTVP
jgi:hypothetical protein